MDAVYLSPQPTHTKINAEVQKYRPITTAQPSIKSKPGGYRDLSGYTNGRVSQLFLNKETFWASFYVHQKAEGG